MPIKTNFSPNSTRNDISRNNKIKKRPVGANRDKLTSSRKRFPDKSIPSKLTAKQVETIRRLHDQEMKAEKRKKIIIIVVVTIMFVLALIAVAIVLLFLYLGPEDGGTISNLSSISGTSSSTLLSTGTTLPPLQNLTEDCFKKKPYYYHAYQYPKNCISTSCGSAQYKFTSWLHFYFSAKTHGVESIDVKEGTICGFGKSCQNRTCKKTNDPRAKIVNKPSVYEGWRHNCHDPVQFIDDSPRQNVVHRLKNMSYCPPKTSSSCVQGETVDIISIHFLICNDPLPVPLGAFNKTRIFPDCIELTEQPPFFINKVCEVCPNKTTGQPPDDNCELDELKCGWRCGSGDDVYTYQFAVGTPCKVGKINWDKYPLYCVGKYCLPVYSLSPHTFNIPRSKCSDD